MSLKAKCHPVWECNLFARSHTPSITLLLPPPIQLCVIRVQTLVAKQQPTRRSTFRSLKGCTEKQLSLIRFYIFWVTWHFTKHIILSIYNIPYSVCISTNTWGRRGREKCCQADQAILSVRYEIIKSSHHSCVQAEGIITCTHKQSGRAAVYAHTWHLPHTHGICLTSMASASHTWHLPHTHGICLTSNILTIQGNTGTPEWLCHMYSGWLCASHLGLLKHLVTAGNQDVSHVEKMKSNSSIQYHLCSTYRELLGW